MMPSHPQRSGLVTCRSPEGADGGFVRITPNRNRAGGNPLGRITRYTRVWDRRKFLQRNVIAGTRYSQRNQPLMRPTAPVPELLLIAGQSTGMERRTETKGSEFSVRLIIR